MRTVPKRGRIILTAALLSLGGGGGCDMQSAEERARETSEKVQESIQSKSARALEQKASAEDIKQAQEALTAAKEYLGEMNGVLDPVTVNAIQAFQRAHGLDDDGILDDETKKLLSEIKKGGVS